MRHKLKSWLGAFSDVVAQVKRCEVRRCDDRTFNIGDELELHEYDNEKEKYTGRATLVQVTHVIRHAGPMVVCGVTSNQVDVIPVSVMSIVPIPWKV